MLASKHRQVFMMRRISLALNYLQGEATAAALDEVAEAIADAERSVSLICQNGPLRIGDEAGKSAADGPRQEIHEHGAGPLAPTWEARNDAGQV